MEQEEVQARETGEAGEIVEPSEFADVAEEATEEATEEAAESVLSLADVMKAIADLAELVREQMAAVAADVAKGNEIKAAESIERGATVIDDGGEFDWIEEEEELEQPYDLTITD